MSRRDIAHWLRLVYRTGRAAGLTPREARQQARESVSPQLPF